MQRSHKRPGGGFATPAIRAHFSTMPDFYHVHGHCQAVEDYGVVWRLMFGVFSLAIN
jgi:hypothetical protein